VSSVDDDIHQIWIDPGFQHRQESSQNLLTPRVRKSRPTSKRRRR
jgi:hypothetical protein